MATVYNNTSNAVMLKLNMGTQDGRVKTANVSLGKLSATSAGDPRDSTARGHIAAIAPILENCLTNEIYYIEATSKGRITEEG